MCKLFGSALVGMCKSGVSLFTERCAPSLERSASLGKKINYYMHNIYISITIQFLEAINFIELTLIHLFLFFSLFPLPLLQAVGSCPTLFNVKLLAVVRRRVNCGSEDNCFLKINIYFILL